MKKRVNWKIFLASFAIVFLTAFLGSIFTAQNTKSQWYESIKPSITPPSYIFPIAWTILFILIGFSIYFSWTNSNKNQKTKLAILFAINLIANVLWSLLFFSIKQTQLAFLDLIIIWASTLYLIIFLWKINKKSALLLIPYILWLSFAGILNYLIAF
ncbi:MAG: TspO/MBR family protein [Nanoarchaeota archaeon]|nr:TspO/MBR family protein [Nanoarchaeota archaeon]